MEQLAHVFSLIVRFPHTTWISGLRAAIYSATKIIPDAPWHFGTQQNSIVMVRLMPGDFPFEDSLLATGRPSRSAPTSSTKGAGYHPAILFLWQSR